MKDIPAIGPGGKHTGKTYGEYEKTAQQLRQGPARRLARTATPTATSSRSRSATSTSTPRRSRDPAQRELLKYACQIAGENGTPYFVFDRDEVTLSACCRLRTTITDNYMIKHLECMRFCGFQNITINLPAGRLPRGPRQPAGAPQGSRQGHGHRLPGAPPEEEVHRAAHERPEHAALGDRQEGRATAGRTSTSTRRTYIIGLVGLNECVQYLTGEELHESDEALQDGPQDRRLTCTSAPRRTASSTASSSPSRRAPPRAPRAASPRWTWPSTRRPRARS